MCKALLLLRGGGEVRGGGVRGGEWGVIGGGGGEWGCSTYPQCCWLCTAQALLSVALSGQGLVLGPERRRGEEG